MLWRLWVKWFTGVAMSEDLNMVEAGLANDGAATEHVKTYERVMGVLKWGTVAVAVALIIMAICLVN